MYFHLTKWGFKIIVGILDISDEANGALRRIISSDFKT